MCFPFVVGYVLYISALHCTAPINQCILDEFLFAVVRVIWYIIFLLIL